MFLGLYIISTLLKTQKPSVKNKSIDLGVKSEDVSWQEKTNLYSFSLSYTSCNIGNFQ